MKSHCSGKFLRACSFVITAAILITPIIAPSLPQRCKAISPRTFSPHDLFSIFFLPAAICEAKGSLTESVFMPIMYNFYG